MNGLAGNIGLVDLGAALGRTLGIAPGAATSSAPHPVSSLSPTPSFSRILRTARQTPSVSSATELPQFKSIPLDDAMLLALSVPNLLEGLDLDSLGGGDLSLQELLSRIGDLDLQELESQNLREAMEGFLQNLQLEFPDGTTSQSLLADLGLAPPTADPTAGDIASRLRIDRAAMGNIRVQELGRFILERLRQVLAAMQDLRAQRPPGADLPAQSIPGSIAHQARTAPTLHSTPQPPGKESPQGAQPGSFADPFAGLQIAPPRQFQNLSTAKTGAQLPDLIYQASHGGDNPLRAHGAPGEIRLLALPRQAVENPLETLQRLVDRLETLTEGNSRPSGGPSQHGVSDGMATPWRIGETGRGGDFALRLLDAGRPEPSHYAESVRQAQAALADMAERLRGDIRFDAGRLRATLHLEPPALGRLHVQLALQEGDRVLAHFQSDNPASQDYLREHSQDLRQGLADQGFDETKIEILFDDEEAFAETLNTESPQMGRMLA